MTTKTENEFKTSPGGYAIRLVEEGMTSWETLARAFIGTLSGDDIRDVLDANELSPRFEEDEDEDSESEEDAQ